MAHIQLNNDLPGIQGPMAYRPETEKPLRELAEALLRGPSTLSHGERELIATYVSSLNDCFFCQTSHGAAAACYLNDMQLVLDVKKDPSTATISNKLKALLNIAAKVQKGGKNVMGVDIEVAKKEGATDLEIHDTVLIAAAFCMFNRYVDGLDTWAPQDISTYTPIGERIMKQGYIRKSLV
jgi:uncharacterized peroxidase-related enzyme